MHELLVGARSSSLALDRATTRSFWVEREEKPGVLRLILRGELTLANGDDLWRSLKAELAPRDASIRQVEFALNEVEKVDGGALALIVAIKNELESQSMQVSFESGSSEVQELIHLYKGDVRARRRKKQRPEGMLAQIGRSTLTLIFELKFVLDFVGRLAIALVRTIRAPRSVNWRDVPNIMERAGADAVPIVLLINFLIGFVSAYQAAGQLKQYGADIFVADLVGISTARELGPLMTAIIVSGRSGAAFAAELGSMTVAEEIDALHTMGFGAIRFLVIPRTLALLLVVPLLTILADVVAIVGGLVVSVMNLDLTVTSYLNETQKAVTVWDVSSGLIKSAVFALAIGIIACQQGLAASGGAEGVGRRTTSSVVSILFMLILIDTAFTILFKAFGL